MLTYDAYFTDRPEDEAKFSRIYNSYRNAMFYTANSILKDPWLAEDAVQEALLRIVINLYKIDEETPARTKGFVATVARNVALTMRQELSMEIPTMDDEMLFLFPPDTNTPESIFLDKEMSEHLMHLMSDMTEDHQNILTMVYLHGYKIGKAAELLGLPGDVARKRLQRAKAALKKKLLQEAEA